MKNLWSIRAQEMCWKWSPWQCLVFRRGTFSVVGSCELQKQHVLGNHTPEHCLQRSLQSLKRTAWVGIISKHGIIGPFWFEDNNEHCVTINTDRYVQVLRKFWTALGRWKEVVRVRQWFKHDGATPHSWKESVAWLNQRFSDRLISCKCDQQWSPYSPDLNPLDFYLWRYLKDRVYVHNP